MVSRCALGEIKQHKRTKELLQDTLVCPSCVGDLTFRDSDAECSRCGSRFSRRNGIWDFTLGESFPDEEDSERWEREELQDVSRAHNYSLPFFESLQTNNNGQPLRALSVGCGVAAEVDRLVEAGIDCYGVDCGNRALVWARRSYPSRLLRANGMHLPFPNGHFDIVFAGCVFPHIGVVGDTFQVRPDYRSARLQLAREMVRVCRPGGSLMISCPNRLFPLDLFHRLGSGYVPRLHMPTEPFLLSLKDFKKMFVEECGCRRVRALPAANYWTFNELTRSRKGRLLAAGIRFYLRLVSMKFAGALHGSFLTPWLIVSVER